MGGWSKGKSSRAVLSLQIWPCLSRELGNFGRAHEKPYAKLAGALFLPEAKLRTCDIRRSTCLPNHERLHFERLLSISDSAHHQIGPDVTASGLSCATISRRQRPRWQRCSHVFATEHQGKTEEPPAEPLPPPLSIRLPHNPPEPPRPRLTTRLDRPNTLRRVGLSPAKCAGGGVLDGAPDSGAPRPEPKDGGEHP